MTGNSGEKDRNRLGLAAAGIIAVIFLIYLLYQHSLIPLMFDDYGYAALSYCQLPGYEEVVGHTFTLPQLLNFLYHQYMELGGRVVSFFIQIGIGSFGVKALQVYQALAIWGIFLCMTALAVKRNSWHIVLNALWGRYAV